MALGRSRRRGSGHALTPRQVQIMDLLGRGYRTREIARALNISERAITAHITKLMAIFGVPNRTGLIAAGMTTSSQARLAKHDERELDRYEDAHFLVEDKYGP